MIDQAAKALEELSRREHFTQPDDLVFCTTLGGVIEGSALYRRYRRTCKRAGLRELRLHDLRHTAISMWVQIWPLSEVQAYAGHANISTTMIYAHHQPRANAAEKLGAFVDAEIGLSEMPLTTDEGEREGQEVDG
jgi:integrase